MGEADKSAPNGQVQTATATAIWMIEVSSDDFEMVVMLSAERHP
jgi:hypothetical protein